MGSSLSKLPADRLRLIRTGVVILFVGALAMSGCVAALIGGGAAGTYAIAKSERSAGEIGSDALITMKVKAKLLADSKVRGLNMDVDTNLGNVTLTGVARSQEEIDRAMAITRTVDGVISVKSNLQLRGEQEEKGERKEKGEQEEKEGEGS